MNAPETLVEASSTRLCARVSNRAVAQNAIADIPTEASDIQSRFAFTPASSGLQTALVIARYHTPSGIRVGNLPRLPAG